jgi:hypothetical protein
MRALHNGADGERRRGVWGSRTRVASGANKILVLRFAAYQGLILDMGGGRCQTKSNRVRRT